MQYIYTMNGVSKIVPPKRQIIKDISLSFFPGAKIGLLGLNGDGAGWREGWGPGAAGVAQVGRGWPVVGAAGD